MQKKALAGLALATVLGVAYAVYAGKPAAKEAAEANQGDVQGIAWSNSLADALKTAKASRKPVMVDFYADWCGWCHKLDRDVYTNSEVVGLAQGFISVKVDTDRSPDDARKYEVQGLPTIVFLNPDGGVITGFVGYRQSDDFVRVMKDILNKGA